MLTDKQPFLNITRGQSLSGFELGREIITARAHAILRICQSTYDPHSLVVVPAISNIINDLDTDHVSVHMALTALACLCANAHVDPHTAWAALSSKLDKVTHSRVSAPVCRLFANYSAAIDSVYDCPVESLYEASASDERQYALQFLWTAAANEDAAVRMEALQGLARFHPGSTIIYKYEPEPPADGDDNALGQEPEEPEYPFHCRGPSAADYERLLRSMPTDEDQASGTNTEEAVIKTLQFFRSAIACEIELAGRRECASWRRGGSHHLTGGRATGAVHHLDRDICRRLEDQYKRTSRPGLRKGLGAGLLFAYQPHYSTTSADASPMQQYLDSMNDLLLNVGLSSDTYHSRIRLQSGWSTFMRRALHTIIEALDETQDSAAAIVSARDLLFDKLKGKFEAIKRTPQMESNFLLAIGGLAAALPEHAERYTWLSQVFTTCVCALTKDTHQPTALCWALDTTASTEARFAAACTAGTIGPLLRSSATSGDAYTTVLEVLCKHLTNRNEPPIVGQGCAIGLLHCFDQTSVGESADLQKHRQTRQRLCVEALWDFTKANSEGASDPELTTSACMSLASIDLSKVAPDLRDTAVKWWVETAQAICTKEPAKTHAAYSPSVYVLACAWCTQLWDEVDGIKYVEKLRKAIQVALGEHLDLLWLAKIHLRKHVELSNESIMKRLGTSTSSTVTSTRVAAVVSMGHLLDAPAASEMNPDILAHAAKQLEGLLLNDNVQHVSSAAAVVLGRLSQTHKVQTSMSASYDYLPDTFAALQAVFRTVQTQPSATACRLALTCIMQCTILPPVDWKPVLLNILGSNLTPNVKTAAVTFALSRIGSVSSSYNIVEMMLTTQMFGLLPAETQAAIVGNLAKLLAAVPETVLAKFLVNTVPRLFAVDDVGQAVALLTAALRGLVGSLDAASRISSYDWAPHFIAAVTAVYHTMTGRQWEGLLLEQRMVPDGADGTSTILDLLSQCVSQLPPKLAETLTESGADTTYGNALLCAMVRARLVANAGFPIGWMRSSVAWVLDSKNASQAEKSKVSFVIGNMFVLASEVQQKHQIKLVVDILDRLVSGLPGTGAAESLDACDLEIGLNLVSFIVASNSALDVTHVHVVGTTAHVGSCFDGARLRMFVSRGLQRLTAMKDGTWLHVVQCLLLVRKSSHCSAELREFLHVLLFEARHVPAVRESDEWFSCVSAWPARTVAPRS